MALSITSIVADVGSFHAVQPTATATRDVLKGSAGTLFKVEIDNTAGLVPVWVKFYEHATPTIGTTVNAHSFYCAAGSTAVYSNPAGTAMGTAISMATVTDGGGTAGTTDPLTNVIVRVQYA
tara:strand:- start:2471 stop:2836 length:366 start_codon:yes stop_codon:yes gene_type:complete